MTWQKEQFLRPTQPYFVLEADHFQQEVYWTQGISHFYTFDLPEARAFDVVPDACIDLVFQYTKHAMDAYACGPVLSCQRQNWDGNQDVFGVRFIPGYHPAGIDIEWKDLIGHRIPLKQLMKDTILIDKMATQMDFYQRIRIFLQEYAKLEKQQEKPYGKRALVMDITKRAYLSDGLIRISSIAEQTGYSESYINRVFHEQMGFSPKTFCKIIQFQRALEFLNYGQPNKMTEAAVNLGYYDQSQFIRDFKKYAGITPKQYLKRIEQEQYKNRIKDTNYLSF